MKPDVYFPFYAIQFWQAVEGLPDFVITGYLRAITYYWCNTHCSGLRDERDFLRRVCRVDPENWDEACAAIFDNDRFFTLVDGQWQQRKAQELWREAESAYDKRCRRTKEATAARWSK